MKTFLRPNKNPRVSSIENQEAGAVLGRIIDGHMSYGQGFDRFGYMFRSGALNQTLHPPERPTRADNYQFCDKQPDRHHTKTILNITTPSSPT